MAFQESDSRIFRQSYLEKTHDFYRKYGGKTIILARFVPVVRTFAPVWPEWDVCTTTILCYIIWQEQPYGYCCSVMPDIFRRFAVCAAESEIAACNDYFYFFAAGSGGSMSGKDSYP